MKLRNGKNYQWVNSIDIDKVITIQSFARGFIVKTQFNKLIHAIHLLHKQAPHLYKYNPRKPRNKKPKINEFEELGNTLEMDEITKQYNLMKHLGRSVNRRGLIRSTRKGGQPDRYIDEHFIEIFMENDNVEDFLASSDDEIYSDSEEETTEIDTFINNDSDSDQEDEWEPSSEEDDSD